MSFGYYATLDLLSDASEDQIKRAYFKKMREHPPETDPEGFKQIRQAYDALRDRRSRASHDALHQHGEQIRALMEQAGSLQEEENYKEAIPLLKRVLVLWPEADMARNQLGLCQMYAGDNAGACNIFYGLIQRNKEVPVYWMNYGHSFLEIAKNGEDGDGERHVRYEKARRCFQKAIELEPHNSEPYLLIARTYREQEHYDEAMEWAGKGVMADGSANMDDFESYMFMVITCILAKRFDKVNEVATQILKIVPEDPDARKFVSFRFASLAVELLHLKADADLIVLFVEQALRFDSSEELVEFRDSMRNLRAAGKRIDIFMKDDRIVPPIRLMAAVFYDSAWCEKDDDDAPRRNELFEQSLNELGRYQLAAVKQSVVLLRSNYGPIYYLNDDFFDKIEGVANQSAASEPTPPNQGCLLIMLLAVVVVSIALNI